MITFFLYTIVRFGCKALKIQIYPIKAKTVLRDWQYGKIPYLTQPDEEYESKENKPLKEKNESEAEKQQRMEIIEKRKEIEQKINIDQGTVFWFQCIAVITHYFFVSKRCPKKFWRSSKNEKRNCNFVILGL